MADFTVKPIELVQVGEQVLGRRGEINPVLGKMSCWLQTRGLWRINGGHVTTDEHTHIGPNGFYVISREEQEKDWGHAHWMDLGRGIFEKVLHHGLRADRISDLRFGTELEIYGGVVSVKQLDHIPADAFTLVWNLMIGGSHTYFVDGYCVTGWPREDDWDWDAWKPVR